MSLIELLLETSERRIISMGTCHRMTPEEIADAQSCISKHPSRFVSVNRGYVERNAQQNDSVPKEGKPKG